jgi:phage shock protein E
MTPRCVFLTSVIVAVLAASARSANAEAPENPAIDMPAYLSVAAEAAGHRESRRLSEDEFRQMANEPGTVILDARSREKFELLHVKGAINLSFPDITVASLAAVLPDKDARILIYCNNNFANAERPFPTKRLDASLNLSTYISLYSYGYRNVYELGPLVELASSKLDFESALPTAAQQAE